MYILNFVNSSMSCVSRAISVYDNLEQFATKAEYLNRSVNAQGKDVVIVITRLAIICLDSAAIGSDIASGLLTNSAEISKQNKSSAIYQALALLGVLAVKEDLNLKHADLYRIGSVMKQFGYTYNNNNLKIGGYLTIDVTLLYKFFGNWYAHNHQEAAKVDLTHLSYPGIPVEYYDNPIFKQFTCPITDAPMRFPVTVPNLQRGPDHHYERSAIVNWLLHNKTNPMSRAPLDIKDLRENVDMRNIIEAEMKKLNLPL